ncbi:MAG: UDP-N-acetylmuramoyl-L-alanyl-D-glutamate--2,6-diaminopimelate ligase [Peptostreptococcaceae bacterium]|nr:UDP-N-acetylmuramoyl-L-alanyl-D-glutamate--2,6-diaminopimelate ligase [Peptostreptococcaceae bacterium]
MRLGDLVKPGEYISCKGGKEFNSIIESIVYDSRKVKNGDCFVSIKGYESDGHDFIPKAFVNGAIVFVIDQSSWFKWIIREYPCATVLLVDDSRSMLSKMADRYFGSPSKEMTVIGVTGTNGKTSVTTYIYNALRSLGFSSGLIGTIETRIDDEALPATRTTPESLELQKIFRDMRSKGIRYVVMEVSSHALKLMRVQDVDFDIAVFTNLTQDHLDFHKTMDDYADTKYMLMKKQKKAAIVNTDDAYGKAYAASLSKDGKRVITYGMREAADIMTSRKEPSGEITFKTYRNEKEIKVESSSRFETYNKMAAYAALKEMGFDLHEIQNVFLELEGARGRFQKVPGSREKGIEVIVDYAHTPDALSNVIEAINEYKTGRLIIVFGCGGERDTLKRPIMGRIAYEGSEHVILTDDNPRREDPEGIIKEIESGIVDGNYEVIRNREKAIKKAIMMAKPLDVVLIAGKGHEKLQVIGEESFEHDDFDVARKSLEEVM